MQVVFYSILLGYLCLSPDWIRKDQDPRNIVPETIDIVDALVIPRYYVELIANFYIRMMLQKQYINCYI
ncbi:MAG: hypothetical protein JXJ04_05430 [Spirochaetales bacterium]|nr:hypothetical protein [Spirochaetales bacterium]